MTKPTKPRTAVYVVSVNRPGLPPVKAKIKLAEYLRLHKRKPLLMVGDTFLSKEDNKTRKVKRIERYEHEGRVAFIYVSTENLRFGKAQITPVPVAFGLFDYTMFPKLNRILKSHGIRLRKRTRPEDDQVEISVEVLR